MIRAAGALAMDAVVLAGGRGSRLGSVDKAAIELRDRRLVDRAVSAARGAGAGRVIVAGPAHAGALADLVVREDPPFSGPAAAIGAAMDGVLADWTLLLACDLVHPGRAAFQLAIALHAALRRARGPVESAGVSGVILVDDSGCPQWLASCVRTAHLRASLEGIRKRAGGSLANLPARAALEPLGLLRVEATGGSAEDIDTLAHLARAREALGGALP